VRRLAGHPGVRAARKKISTSLGLGSEIFGLWRCRAPVGQPILRQLDQDADDRDVHRIALENDARRRARGGGQQLLEFLDAGWLRPAETRAGRTCRQDVLCHVWPFPSEDHSGDVIGLLKDFKFAFQPFGYGDIAA
jgi:hypothetical protein